MAKMTVIWLGHRYFGGRKKDTDMVWTVGKGGDLEQARGREGHDAVVEKVEWKDL